MAYGRKFLWLVLALPVLAGCSQSFSAGQAGTSADGQPYFIIYDGPTRTCQPPLFDGAAWAGGYDKAVPVSVGMHRFECNGTVITLNMPKGMIYRVDYRQR